MTFEKHLEAIWKQTYGDQEGYYIGKGNKKWEGIEEGAYLAYLRNSNEVSATGIK